MKQLKLTTNEKINLLKYGHIEIERGVFTIIITVDDYGEYEINVLNPYDTEKLAEEMKSLAIHLGKGE
jgi:hypothetical protein